MEAEQTADFEGFVLKAASAAYKKVFPNLDVNMARVEADGIRFYQNANEMLIGQY